MTSQDALNEKRAALEATVQVCSMAGVEVPEATITELAAIDAALAGVPRIESRTPPKSWTQWLGTTLDNNFIKRFLYNDSYAYTFGALGAEHSASGDTASDHPLEFVYKIAKPQELVVKPESRPPRDHSTMVLKLEPFDTRPVTPDSNAMIDLQYERLNSYDDKAVMPATDINTIDALNYYQMPFIKGKTLKDLMVTRAPNDRMDLLPHLVKCAQTLGRLSISQGFYHGNLKPANIIVTDDGVMLTDLGYFGELASAEGFLEQAMVSNTSYYPMLAPDDLFALGIILFELLTGTHPFAPEHVLIAIDDQSGQSHLDSELTDEINFKRSILEPYLTPLLRLQRPRTYAPWLSSSEEALLLKGLRLRLAEDGLLHKDAGFSDFAELASSLWTLSSQELADGSITVDG